MEPAPASTEVSSPMAAERDEAVAVSKLKAAHSKCNTPSLRRKGPPEPSGKKGHNAKKDSAEEKAGEEEQRQDKRRRAAVAAAQAMAFSSASAHPSRVRARRVRPGRTINPVKFPKDAVVLPKVKPAGESKGPPGVCVVFEDGPEMGVFAEVTEDDFCDLRFWKFQEKHKQNPACKILLSDGLAIFIVEWPVEPEGMIIDENGDLHGYVREDRIPLPEPSIGGKTVTKQMPTRGTKRQHSRENATSAAKESVEKTSGRGSVDEAAAAGEVRKSRRHGGQNPEVVVKQLGTDLVETRVTTEQEVSIVGNRQFQRRSVGASPTVATKVVAEPVQQPGPTATPRCNLKRPLEGNVAQSVKPRQQTADIAESSTMAPAPEFPRCSVHVERAKVSRCICRLCEQCINREELRCGIDGNPTGKMQISWVHAECFLERICVEYCTRACGKCKGSGVAFQKGDVRVGFDVGQHVTWWSLKEAAIWINRILSEGGRLETVRGIETINPEHRAPLLNFLRRGPTPRRSLQNPPPLSKAMKLSRHGSSAKSQENVPGPPAARFSIRTSKMRKVKCEPEEKDAKSGSFLDVQKKGGKSVSLGSKAVWSAPSAANCRSPGALPIREDPIREKSSSKSARTKAAKVGTAARSMRNDGYQGVKELDSDAELAMDLSDAQGLRFRKRVRGSSDGAANDDDMESLGSDDDGFEMVRSLPKRA